MEVSDIAVNPNAHQGLNLQAIKNTANAQKQLASVLDKAAQEQPKLRTSGSVGTKVNTSA